LLKPLTGKAELLNADQQVDVALRQAATCCPEKCILIAEEPEPST